MAANFRILVHRSSESLHLKLLGDFDATSAQELFSVLKQTGARVDRIFVHTNGIETIHPSGRAVFIDNFFSLRADQNRIIFTGKNTAKIAPEGGMSIIGRYPYEIQRKF